MFVQAGDTHFHVQVDGPAGAPPLLLLHSLGTSLAVWDGLIPSLSHSLRVVRLDLRGHGLSGCTPGPYTIDGMARDCAAVLDQLEIDIAHVAGLSIGGMIAQAIASQAPKRVASLILCDTAMAIPPPELWRERAAIARQSGLGALADAVMSRWVTPRFRSTPESAGLLSMLLRTDPEGYAAAAEAIATADLTASTRALHVPALILVGERTRPRRPPAPRHCGKPFRERAWR